MTFTVLVAVFMAMQVLPALRGQWLIPSFAICTMALLVSVLDWHRRIRSANVLYDQPDVTDAALICLPHVWVPPLVGLGTKYRVEAPSFVPSEVLLVKVVENTAEAEEGQATDVLAEQELVDLRDLRVEHCCPRVAQVERVRP